MSENTHNVTRRRLVRGAVWSVPAVTIAAPAMASTCSPQRPCTHGILEGAWKVPGNSCAGYPKGYVMAFRVCNDTSVAVEVSGFRLTNTKVDGKDRAFQLTGGSTATLAKGECKLLWFGTDGFNNSHERRLSGTVNYVATTAQGGSTSQSIDFDAGAGTPFSSDETKCPPLGSTPAPKV